MKDHIVQEVRDARVAVGADFGFDLQKFFTWAKAHAAAERKAKCRLPTDPGKKAREATNTTTKPPAVRTHRVRSSGASAQK